MRIGVGAQLLSYPRASQSGLGTYVRHLVTALPGAINGHRLDIFWGREGVEVAPELTPSQPGLRHHFSSVPLRRRFVRVPWEHVVLPLAARRAGVDVFHFPDQVVSLVPPAPRTVVTIHDLASFRYPETYGGTRARYKELMTRLSVRTASRVIAISETTKRELIELLRVDERRIRVVHRCLDARFRPIHDRQRQEEVRTRLGLPERFLLYVGSLEPRKNLERIIRGYALARQQFGVQIPLVLVGQRAWLYERALRLPSELGIQEHVWLSGYVADSDLPALYSQCQAFVFPTLYEGFGMPALEAMACGVPVIGSTAAALPEIIGEAGLLVDPLDVEAIGAAIHRAVSDRDLRSRLAEAGPRRASLFSWERAARETVAVYGEVIRG